MQPTCFLSSIKQNRAPSYRHESPCQIGGRDEVVVIVIIGKHTITDTKVKGMGQEGNSVNHQHHSRERERPITKTENQNTSAQKEPGSRMIPRGWGRKEGGVGKRGGEEEGRGTLAEKTGEGSGREEGYAYRKKRKEEGV